MTERRYTEDEVAAIFERAAHAEATGHAPTPARAGRTLAELQEIGEEVGLSRELVARAARAFDAPRSAAGRSFLGLPLAVGRTVDLQRTLSDDEWNRLVVDLRETFDARGTVRTHGDFREWTNGNLQALLEPTEDGHRLRLRTLKGNARSLMAGGLCLIGMAVAILIAFFLTGDLAGDWPATVVLGLMGAGFFGAGALQLPGWAATRLEQMEGVAARLTDGPSAAAGPPPPAHATNGEKERP